MPARTRTRARTCLTGPGLGVHRLERGLQSRYRRRVLYEHLLGGRYVSGPQRAVHPGWRLLHQRHPVLHSELPGGKCSNQQCLDVGGTCATAEACCTKICGGVGKCAALPAGTTSCKVPGQACGGNGDCCSTNCQGGLCKPAYSCQANDDICLKNEDCCGGVCSQNATGTPGRCVAVGGSGGGNCVQDGNPCTGGSTCCSRTCVDLGYGATVCQPVNGCRPTGNYCAADGVCCGGEKLSNAVDCRENRCDKPNGCNPMGNICGSGMLPDGGSVDVNAREACCDGQKAVCKVDSAGVPRCFGGCPSGQCPASCPTGYTGEAGCCIPQGNTCQFSDQCCNGNRCLPGANGAFTCQPAPTCSPVGTVCNPASSGCCAGTACRAIDELTYVCRPTGTSPGGGTDGGTGGVDAGPVCRPNGQVHQRRGLLLGHLYWRHVPGAAGVPAPGQLPAPRRRTAAPAWAAASRGEQRGDLRARGHLLGGWPGMLAQQPLLLRAVLRAGHGHHLRRNPALHLRRDHLVSSN